MSNSQWHEDQAGERALRQKEEEAKLLVLTEARAREMAFHVARRVYDECHAGGHPTLATVVDLVFAEYGMGRLQPRSY